jgi:23S rRNA (adenine2503-C2)-methyltransferase
VRRVTKRLSGVDRDALGAAATAVGEPPTKQKMRGKQLFHWMYHRGATDFDTMTSISMDLRARMKAAWDLRRDKIATEQISVDGTRKWLVELEDGAKVESVLIPEDDRGALCISTQVGCTLNCSFCHTGTQPWVRNLTAEEIVGQVLIARDVLGEWPSPSEGRLISNIVLMGMGEPLLNYDNVVKALKIIMDPEGISISRRRITVSTAGVVPMIGRLGAETGVGLAISLHAVRDDVRNELVPLNRKHPIADLLDACRTYPGASNARRITFEYAMLKGVNDSPQDAKELVQLIAGIPAKVNLIPFNPWPGTIYQVSDDATIAAFAEIVNKAGYASPIRVPRGQDISAACGQLKSDSVRMSAKDRQPA